VAQKRAQDRETERLEIMARSLQRCVIRDGDAVDPLERQDPLGCTSPVDARHAQATVRERLVRHDVVGHFGDGGGFQPEVHLDLDTACERVDHDDGAQAPCRQMPTLDLPRREEVAVEIAAEAPLDAGAQDLDCHLTARPTLAHHGLVHLGDGGGRNRRSEFREVVL
jgi:hypothetical protein